jgi:orotidine-5'-phosphate decarboxylase
VSKVSEPGPEQLPRIIVALDLADPYAALGLADRLDPSRCRVKVGNELFTRGGPGIVGGLRRRGFEIFLDLKFHDIPNTVAGACRATAGLDVWMVNVHASGGRRMMEAAREALEASSPRPLLTAVTVLTSLDDDDLEEAGFSGTPRDSVLRLARLAEDAGFDGVVCSPVELEPLSGVVGDGFLRVTPGIRPADSDCGDQKRVMTPAEAVSRGAHYLVIGRPITDAPDPAAALAAIAEEIASAAA